MPGKKKTRKPPNLSARTTELRRKLLKTGAITRKPARGDEGKQAVKNFT